jgi:hypothetical protein
MVILVVACLLIVVAFRFWKAGTPFQARAWSPNQRYYVQKYANWGPSCIVPAGPGQGSDTVGGYVRLYSRDGRMLHERFARFSRDIQPVWSREKVYLLGIPETESAPWILPDSSE